MIEALLFLAEDISRHFLATMIALWPFYLILFVLTMTLAMYKIQDWWEHIQYLHWVRRSRRNRRS